MLYFARIACMPHQVLWDKPMKRPGIATLVLTCLAGCAQFAAQEPAPDLGQPCWRLVPDSIHLLSADPAALRFADQACQSALEVNADGVATKWYAPLYKFHGSVSPTASYRVDGTYCRTYSVSVGRANVDSSTTLTTRGTACRSGTGAWWAWEADLPSQGTEVPADPQLASTK